MKSVPSWRAFALSTLAWSLCAAAHAQAAPARTQSDWVYGAVVDLGFTTRALALGTRDKGLQLGHSDVTAAGPLGRHLKAQITASFETHDGKLEGELEEAWLETTSLPAGVRVRAGRFASQIGYLNGQHKHADDFVERPLLYRSMLGSHYNDDGVRIAWTLPTSGLFWTVGAEALRGKRLVEEAANRAPTLGVTTLATKLGADVGRSHSWQVGMSYVRNRREAVGHDGHEGEAGHDEHGHGARYSGKNMWLIDATWKWAPDGNNRKQQVRATFEAARIAGHTHSGSAGGPHNAQSLTLVWRFAPSWEVGARQDWLRVSQQHEDHVDRAQLSERALMLAWKPSHRQSLRLQYTAQGNARGFDDTAKRSLQLQYVLSFGAHGAHSF